VTILSSRFNHQAKVQRKGPRRSEDHNKNLSTILVASPGYKKNIGLRRFVDHWILGLRCYFELKKLSPKPDLLFIGYPPVEVGFFAALWSSRAKVPSYLDTKDLWPDLIVEAFPEKTQRLVRMILYPYFLMSEFTHNQASALCATSPAYLRWMQERGNRHKGDLDIAVALSSPDPEALDNTAKDKALAWWQRNRHLDVDRDCRFIFVGTYMSVFDFEPIKLVGEKLMERGCRFEFVFCGAGAYEQSVRDLFEGVNFVKFVDWIEYPQLVALATISRGAFVPYKNIKNYELNIPNKVVDALALGLPILSPTRGEISKLIKTKNVGQVLDVDNLGGTVDGLYKILMVNDYFLELRKNCKREFYKNYTIEKNYGGLIENFERLVQA
jgi:glycosyltransferase involved in cell wall biosynthesis